MQPEKDDTESAMRSSDDRAQDNQSMFPRVASILGFQPSKVVLSNIASSLTSLPT